MTVNGRIFAYLSALTLIIGVLCVLGWNYLAGSRDSIRVLADQHVPALRYLQRAEDAFIGAAHGSCHLALVDHGQRYVKADTVDGKEENGPHKGTA